MLLFYVLVAEVLELLLADGPIQVLEDHSGGRHEHVGVLQLLYFLFVVVLELFGVLPVHPRLGSAYTLISQMEVSLIVLIQLDQVVQLLYLL